MSGTATQRDAVQYVVDAIEATGIASSSEYDIDTIIDTLYGAAGCWDFSQVQSLTFWQTVADSRH
jgi:hypothetical protein